MSYDLSAALDYGYSQASQMVARPLDALRASPTVQGITQGVSAVCCGIRDAVNYVNERKVQITAIACIMLMASYYYLKPDAEDVLSPECTVNYGATSLSSDIVPASLKEYFVISHLGGSAVTQKIIEFVNLGLGLECLKNQWMNITFEREQPEQQEFENLITSTLQGRLPGYSIEHNPRASTNYSSILYNRAGYKVAILKEANWRERFFREFNADGHLTIPRIKEIEVPEVDKKLVAIEFMQGAAMRYSRGIIDNYGNHKFYETLSATDLGHAISQRQRILIMDILTQNHDRHGYSIMVGCRNGHVALHPIDHDCAATKFLSRIDGSLNPFMRSTFSAANREYIQSLSFGDIDRIVQPYKGNIDQEASWFIQYWRANPTIRRVDALKIFSVILKVAVEKQINMAQLNILFNLGTSLPLEGIDAQESFLLGTKHQARHSERLIRDWIEENKIIEELMTPEKYGYRREVRNDYY